MRTRMDTAGLGLLALTVLALPAQATQYDAILEWDGPYFRAIRALQDQATDVPVLETAFLTPYTVAAREHDDRDVIYVLDSGNRRIQAFEVNATFEYVVNADLTYRSSGTAGTAEWGGDEIRLPGWGLVANRWIVPRSEEVIIDGTEWSWVSDLTGYDAASEVYTIDYDAAASGPRILFPSTSLHANSSFRVSYLVSDDQTGASAAYGIGEVDYGTGEGASPVFTEIDGTSGGPVSFQSLRGLALIRNETTASSDDLFVVDYADNSGGLGESLFYYTVDTDGTVTFREAFSDTLLGPFDVAVARSGASSAPAVSLSSDLGLFDQGSAAIVDPNQVTGHTYEVTIVGSDAIVEDTTTGRILVSQDLISAFADPFYLIPGLELRTQVPTQSVTIRTTRAQPRRQLFVAEADGDRITVISAADGASFAGDWLPLDPREVVTQPGALLGGVEEVDYAESTPGSVPANWTHWTAAAPIAEGSLDSLVFAVDGTWTRVDSLGSAGPSDKAFQLDRATGRIRFGDGTNGSLPPASEELTYEYAITPVVLRFGESGTGEGQFDTPKGITARWNPGVGGYDVYVADSGNDRVQKLRFYEEDPALGLLARMEYVTQWSAASSASDTLLGPTDVVVHVDGDSPAKVWVAVADTGNDRIVLYEDVAAGAVGGSTDPPVFELVLGTSGTSLGSYQSPVGVEFLSNGTDLDLYAVDASRGIVCKYERAPDPAVYVNWQTEGCYGPRASYTFSFATVNPPEDGWVDFYFDTASTFDEGSARLALPSASVPADDGSAVWTFDDTPGGAPAAGTYYLFAVLYDSEGEPVHSTGTNSSETLCLDATIVPTLGIRDAIDGDSTLYFQNGSAGILRLVVAHPDSVVAVGYEATFNPTVIEVLSISSGTAWDGTGATSVVFDSRIDNTAGTFEVSSTGLDTPIGLTGTGPHVVANVQLRLRPGVLDLETRYVDSLVHLEASGTSMTNLQREVSADLLVQDLDVRVAYLGDIATVGEGADGEVGSLAPNPDGYIDFADVMAFTLGWNGADFTRDRIADIGPAVGTPPDLVPNPDGEWNIDDLVVLTQMYSWASEMEFSRPGGTPRPGEALRLGDTLRPVDARLPGYALRPGDVPSIGYGDDDLEIDMSVPRWSAGEEITVSLRTRHGDDALGADIWIEFEPDALEFVEAEPGGFLLGTEGQIFLPRKGPGWVEIAGTRLGQGPALGSGDEAFAQLRFRVLQEGPVPLRVHHELRDGRGRLLALGWVDESGGSTGPAPEPAVLRLLPPLPNPTTGPARIRFELPVSSDVHLRILDAGGRTVRTLLDGRMEAGLHERPFDGQAWGGRRLAPGVYFAQLQAGSEAVTRKLVIVR